MWAAMLAGASGVGPISRFDTTGWPVKIAGEVRGLDTRSLLGHRLVKRMDRFIQLAMVASMEAAAQAGFSKFPPADAHRVGVYVGSGIGGLEEISTSAVSLEVGDHKSISAFFIPRVLVNLAAGHIAQYLGARGPSLSVATACATGTHSIGEAARAIRAGMADVVVAGGSEAAIVPLALAGFSVMKALSRRNDDPTGASRPFDRGRDGFVMSEGAGILVLEELEHARSRSAEILAELVGYGLTNDAHHITLPPDDGSGAARCMALSLADARMEPSEIQYINAHGTSTVPNDLAETRAIKAVFGDHARRLAISSTKSVTGHLLGAAGGIEAIATVNALRFGIVPPTATLVEPDPLCDLDYVPGQARELPLYAALSNSFGFGGTNATLVFRRYRG